MNAWLEITKCQDSATSVVLDPDLIRNIRVLSDALLATQAAKSAGIWEYAQKLVQGDLEMIQNSIKFPKRAEDSRSVTHSVDIHYSDSCYTLRLFIEKSQ